MTIEHIKSFNEFVRLPNGQWGGKECFLYGIFAAGCVKIGSSNSPRMRIPEACIHPIKIRCINGIYIVGPVEPRKNCHTAHPVEKMICRALMDFQYPSSRLPRREYFKLPPVLLTAVEDWFKSGCPADGITAIEVLADSIEQAASEEAA